MDGPTIPREQFDELLGGKEELPSAVSFMKYASARSQEIVALTEAVEEPVSKHRTFQKMPRHLRRRAMSHNPKRMPKRLQDAHLKEMEKSGLPVKEKRPSRKHRRRPKYLLQEYNRRQRVNIWLETHIWHAKRFHMTQQWGYKLPDYPNDKSFRALYRATAKHCLIQDLSHLICIELKGKEYDIQTPLSLLTSSDCGLTFAAKSSICGKREGSVMIFKKGTYPYGAVGRVSFMWRPKTDEDGVTRTLWIWCHPAFYQEFLHELVLVFELKQEEIMEVDTDQKTIPEETNVKGKNVMLDISDMEVDKSENVNDKKISEKKNVEEEKLEIKNLNRLPKFTNEKIVLTILKDTLNRFRLTGPLAQIVLTEALKFVDISKFITVDKALDIKIEDTPRSAWLEMYKQESLLKSLTEQENFWNNVLPNINSADELPPRMILSTTVMDPRLSMPATRIKAVYDQVGATQISMTEGLSHYNAIWDTSIRNTVSHSKMSAAHLNSLRSRALVPGLVTVDWLGLHNVSHIPIMLVQNPGQEGYGSGWDIVLPAGWGVPTWLGLIYRGCRAGGLRETERMTLEKASGPILPPDTLAGKERSERLGKQQCEKHFSLPPNKRPNYIKLGITTPFHIPWMKLLQDWYPGNCSTDFYVIRDRKKLNYLRCLLSKTKTQETIQFSELDKSSGLVPVGIEMCGRGSLDRCSLICALRKNDCKLIKEKCGRGPLEPLHEDENESLRKTLRENHLKNLRKLRKKRVKAKRLLEEEGVILEKPKRKVNPTDEIVTEQAERMKSLWLPEEIKSVKNSSSRSVMGFVTCGDFSFLRSKTFGFGYVTLSALLSVTENNQGLCLVRNISSLQYYFARLKLLYPV